MKRTTLFLIAGAVIIVVLIGLFILTGGNTTTSTEDGVITKIKTAQTLSDPEALPGLSTSTMPWGTNIETLSARLDAMGLPQVSMEGQAMHIHQHLDLYVHGKLSTVPASVGIGSNFYSIIHVHDNTGIIHVEAPVVADFTLGEFFDVWGVRFTDSCIGGYCAGDGNTLDLYINGQKIESNYRLQKLSAHEEIAIVFGTKAEVPKTIPSTFAFPSGY